MTYRVVYLMGIPGSGLRDLTAKATAFGNRRGKKFFSVRTSDLLTFAHMRDGLAKPNFEKILTWDEGKERLAVFRALDCLEEYVKQRCPFTPDVVLIEGHACFPHYYGRYHFRPAVTMDALRRSKADTIINVQLNPLRVVENNKTKQWRYLDVEGTATWMCREFAESKQLVQALMQTSQNAPKFFVMGGADNPDVLYRLIMEQDTPICYFSYPITGSTEEKHQQKYLGEILALKQKMEERFIVVHHGGITLEKEDLIEWKGAQEYLRTFQLDMLLSQASVQISVYLRKTEGSVPEISAGVLAEASRASVLGLKTYFLHPRGRAVSPYQIKDADVVVQTQEELFKALDAHGYKKLK